MKRIQVNKYVVFSHVGEIIHKILHEINIAQKYLNSKSCIGRVNTNKHDIAKLRLQEKIISKLNDDINNAQIEQINQK